MFPWAALSPLVIDSPSSSPSLYASSSFSLLEVNNSSSKDASILLGSTIFPSPSVSFSPRSLNLTDNSCSFALLSSMMASFFSLSAASDNAELSSLYSSANFFTSERLFEKALVFSSTASFNLLKCEITDAITDSIAVRASSHALAAKNFFIAPLVKFTESPSPFHAADNPFVRPSILISSFIIALAAMEFVICAFVTARRFILYRAKAPMTIFRTSARASQLSMRETRVLTITFKTPSLSEPISLSITSIRS